MSGQAVNLTGVLHQHMQMLFIIDAIVAVRLCFHGVCQCSTEKFSCCLNHIRHRITTSDTAAKAGCEQIAGTGVAASDLWRYK